MDYNDKVIMRQIILDNYQNPNYKKKTIDAKNYLIANINSPYCIDDIIIGMKFQKEKVVDLVFSGKGCAISIASTNIVCGELKNKNINFVKDYIKIYIKLLKKGIVNLEDQKVLNKAMVFKNTFKQPSRIKCALIGTEGVLTIVNKKENANKI